MCDCVLTEMAAVLQAGKLLVSTVPDTQESGLVAGASCLKRHFFKNQGIFGGN